MGFRAVGALLLLLSGACGGEPEPRPPQASSEETESVASTAPTGEVSSADQARPLAEDACTRDGLVLLGPPEEHEFGWVFPCNSAGYRDTGDVNQMIPGAGPIAVLRDGQIERFGGRPPALVIAQLQQRWREAAR